MLVAIAEGQAQAMRLTSTSVAPSPIHRCTPSAQYSAMVSSGMTTSRSADVIVVMRDGRIVETGAHRQLLDKGGFYAQLYNSQFAH